MSLHRAGAYLRIRGLRRDAAQWTISDMRVILLAGILVSAAALVQAQPAATLLVQGIDGKSVTLTAADLARLPQQTVKTTDHGAPVTFGGVLLSDVLAKVAQPLGENFHGTAASYFLVVEARDHYRAVFAWAELDPGFMDKSIYVVTTRDGKPLAEKDGPYQLIAPGEKRFARWVHMVTALKIQQAK